ncbi:MAG TPA: hypothetical protein VGX94_02110 [Terriglobia bacterium]|nr:hypothetical protein [Terriglobia bacterium]
MRNRSCYVLLLLAIFCSIATLRASDMLYTSASAFDAATHGDQLVTFAAPSSTTFTSYSPTYTDPVTGTGFTIAAGAINVTGKDYYGTGTYPEDFLIEASNAIAVTNLLTVTPPAGDSAIAFDIGSFFSPGSFLVTLSDGTAYTISAPGFSNLGFFGFTSTSGISSISFATAINQSFVMGDATIGQAGATPEPASVVLFVSGAMLLLLMGFFHKRSAAMPSARS